jgi:hypothetical protein
LNPTTYNPGLLPFPSQYSATVPVPKVTYSLEPTIDPARCHSFPGNNLFLDTNLTPVPTSFHNENIQWLPHTDSLFVASPDETLVHDWYTPSPNTRLSPPQGNFAIPSAIEVEPPQPPPSSTVRHVPEIHAPKSPTVACLCDTNGFDIITELQSLQHRFDYSQFDTALILARRGFSIVKSCLACTECLSAQTSLFFACIMIIQQIFTCYGSLRVHSLNMTGPMARTPTIGRAKPTMNVGDIEIDDGEGYFGVLNSVVKGEIERSKGILGGLEQWAQRVGDLGQNTARMLLRTMRDELGC